MSLLKRLRQFSEKRIEELTPLRKIVMREKQFSSEDVEVIMRRLKKMEELSHQASIEFSDPDLKVFESLNFKELFSFVQTTDLDNPNFVYKLERVPDGEDFRETFLKLYDNTSLNLPRRKVLEDILNLHKSEIYSGSVVLAYSQIEGVLTDIFCNINIIGLNSKNKFIALDHNGKPKLDRNQKEICLNGLVSKIEHVKIVNKSAFNKILMNDIESKGLSEEIIFDSYVLNFSNSDSTIPSTRNKILHGQDVSYFTARRSAQLILWLYLILTNIVEFQKAP